MLQDEEAKTEVGGKADFYTFSWEKEEPEEEIDLYMTQW